MRAASTDYICWLALCSISQLRKFSNNTGYLFLSMGKLIFFSEGFHLIVKQCFVVVRAKINLRLTMVSSDYHDSWNWRTFFNLLVFYGEIRTVTPQKYFSL